MSTYRFKNTNYLRPVVEIATAIVAVALTAYVLHDAISGDLPREERANESSLVKIAQTGN